MTDNQQMDRQTTTMTTARPLLKYGWLTKLKHKIRTMHQNEMVMKENNSSAYDWVLLILQFTLFTIYNVST